MNKVLVVATSHKTRGGISSVIKAYQSTFAWKEYHCKWIETHRDGSILIKLGYFLHSFIQFLFLLPFYDIIHIHVGEPPSAIRKCFFMIFIKLFRKQSIVHFHSFSPETTIRSQWGWVYDYLFGRASRIIALSPYWKREIINAFPKTKESKISIIYNPCISEQYHDTFEKKNIILFAGSVIPRKGYKDLITAFANIYDQHNDWKLVIAGNGETDKAESIARELGIAKSVIFPGWVRGKDKDRLFKEARIFCLPSYAEGFPMAVLDAWAYGIPVISTPVGGLPDIVKEGHNALLFPVGDIKSLSEKLSHLMDDSKLQEQLSHEGLTLARTIFDINTTASHLDHIYSDLTKTSKDKRST